MRNTQTQQKIWNSIRLAGLGICVLLFIWSMWPNVKDSRELRFSKQSESMHADFECQRFLELLRSKVTLSYPRSIWYMQTNHLILSIEYHQSQADSLKDNCAVVLETFLDIADLHIEPGPRIYEPIAGNMNQVFIFRITADRNTGIYKGNLWIYANISDEKIPTGPIRVPLFAVPLQIKLNDLLGIPHNILRSGSLVLFLILLTGPKIYQIFK